MEKKMNDKLEIEKDIQQRGWGAFRLSEKGEGQASP
jgi:hypothetical protein